VRTFRVTHLFHPLYGREFTLVTQRHNWSEERVYYYDDHQRLASLPTAWTSLAAVDPFVFVADGRCAFRTQDLIELARLLSQLQDATSSR
jgi:hypothetical protein